MTPSLEPLERASGMVFGRRRRPDLGRECGAESADLLAALDSLLLPALGRQPCLVAFSGGRDSTALLCVATDLARRQGLPDPVPVTLEFAHDQDTREEEWQETTVRRLALQEWLRIPLTDELDALGPMAADALRRHGAYWPPLAHSTIPMLEAAVGGSLLTGNGGDEFLSPWPLQRISRIRRGRSFPRRSELRWAAVFCLPAGVRARVWRRRRPLELGWLTAAADDELQRLWAAQSTHVAPSWADYLESLLDSRYFEVGTAIFQALAERAGVLLVEPFLSPRFVRALAASGPSGGYESRARALEALFGDVLSPDAAARSTKASFTRVPWGPEARAFADTWDGTGLDPVLVDPDALRAEWLSPRPDFRSLVPLQCAWLATHSRSRARISA